MKLGLSFVAAALVLALAPVSSFAQSPSDAQLLRQRYLSDTTGKIREYYVYLPKGYSDDESRRWPVILFLHGAGERGTAREDLEKVLVHGPLMEAWIQRRDLPFIMIVPQAAYPDDHPATGPIPEGYGEKRDLTKPIPPRNEAAFDPKPIPEDWGPLRDRSDGTVLNAWVRMEKDINFMLRVTAADYRVDRKRLYLTGLSMGGFGTFALSAKYAENLAAIVPICGGGDPAAMDKVAESQRPVWVFHGGRDRTVAPSESLRMVNALLEKGHKNVKFTVHEDLGHNVWTRVYASKDFYDWLLEQSLP